MGDTKKKKKIWVTIILIFIFLIAILIGLYKIFVANKSSAMDQFIQNIAETQTDAVTAYGVINIGTKEEALEVENMTSSLVIEKILFESGDTVSEGDELVKFTEESVIEAREELEKNLNEKDLEYRSGAIEYEQSLITAKYTYESTILKGKQADEVYNETVASLKESLESSTKTYDKAMEQLAEYKDAQANNTYYTEYKVEYYKQVYDENLEVLKSKIEEWGVSWPEVTSGGGRLGPDEHSQYQYILSNLYKVLETNLRDYENALDKYETDQADLAYNLLTLQLNMSTLEETYLNAKKSYESSLLTAEQTRQTSKTNAELAESTYEASIEKAKTDYDKLKSAYEEALSDYETFNERIVDNAYIANASGTVMRSNVRTGGKVSAGGRIAMYKDLTDVTVSVSVDQSDIAKLSVGDSAIVYSSSSGLLNGTIKSITPVTQSTSISQVTYGVTVKLDAASSDISSNTTVTVMFGVDLTAGFSLEDMDQSVDGNSFDGMPDFSKMPDFNNMPDFGGSMPDFSNMPNMGGGFNFGGEMSGR